MKALYLKCIFALAVFLAAAVQASPAEKSVYINVHGAFGFTLTSGFEDWKSEQTADYHTQVRQNSKYAESFTQRYGKNENNSIWGICYEAAFFYDKFGIGLSVLSNYSSLNYTETSDREIINKYGTLIAGISGAPDTNILSPTLYYMIELEPVSKSRRFIRLGAGMDFVQMEYKLVIRKNNNPDLPDPSMYELAYSSRTLGWHLSAGYILNYDLWTISGNLSYTRAEASNFKNSGTGRVMRYSDGSKVSTTMHNILFCIGAGLRISWE